MRKLFTLFVFISVIQLNAQNIELGFFIGASNYQGDLQPKHLVFGESKVATGAFIKYRLTDYLKIKATYNKGQISGADYNSTENSGRRNRNLNFKSKLSEFALIAEFNPLPLLEAESNWFAPYLMAGVSIFSFNPQGYYDLEWHDLQPLGTEGQYLPNSELKPYNTTQIAIPLGLGIDFKISDYNKIGLELGIRKTFTDYLDDVSGRYPDIELLAETTPLAATLSYREPEYNAQEDFENPVGRARGNDSKNDLYFFTGVNFTFNLSKLTGMQQAEVYNPF